MVNGFCQGTIIVNGFSIVFFMSEPLFSMVFRCFFFFTFQPLVTMVFQWFLVWQTIGTDGFWSCKLLVLMIFQWFLVQHPLVPMVFWWFCSPTTIGHDTIVFPWFPMVSNHWSNNGMVTIHCYGLVPPIPLFSFEGPANIMNEHKCKTH